MKFNKTVLFILILALAGCKKDGENTGYYFSAFMNGKKYDFNVDLKGSVITPNATTDVRCKVFGRQGVRNDSAVLQLMIEDFYSNELATPGTYPRTNFLVQVFYSDGKNFGVYNNAPTFNNFTIVLNEITNSCVSGTFSGILYSDYLDNIKVTNGKFKAPLLP